MTLLPGMKTLTVRSNFSAKQKSQLDARVRESVYAEDVDGDGDMDVLSANSE